MDTSVLREPHSTGDQGPAALHHLRLGRRRQVDPDRATAARQQADFRGSTGRARARQRQARHHRRRHRFRAPGRRPRGRAAAGHHHRCRLPLLHDPAALLHGRGHAGSRAIYAQHGDRCLDRAACHHPDRRPQGCPGADQAPFLHLLAARHQARRRCRQQDRSGRLQEGRVRSHRRRLRRLCHRSRLLLDRSDSDVGALWRQHHRALGQYRLVSRPLPARLSRKHRRRERDDRTAVPLSRAVGQPPQSRFPRLHRNGGVRQHLARRRDRGVAHPATRAASRRS